MKPIKGFEKYKIAVNGDIFSDYLKGKKIKSYTDKDGYLKVRLWEEGTKKYKNCFVHRLVAQAYLPNSLNKKTVNHINGIKHDNRVENLEWATYSENELHSHRILGKKVWNIRKVKCIDEDIEFSSVKEASDFYGSYSANIIRSIKTGIKVKGHTFKYIE